MVVGGRLSKVQSYQLLQKGIYPKICFLHTVHFVTNLFSLGMSGVHDIGNHILSRYPRLINLWVVTKQFSCIVTMPDAEYI